MTKVACIFGTTGNGKIWHSQPVPCSSRMCSSMPNPQKGTILDPKRPVPNAGTVTFLWMQDSLMLTQGTGLICPESVPVSHRQLDNSTFTSSFSHTWIFPNCTHYLTFCWQWLLYPDKYAIYSPSTALEASTQHSSKPLGNWSLVVTTVWVHNCEAGVSVDGVHNIPDTVHCADGVHDIPDTVHCVGVANTIGRYNIICQPTSKPTNCTSKLDIWNLSIPTESSSAFLSTCSIIIWTKQSSETLKRSIHHSICQPKVRIFPSSWTDLRVRRLNCRSGTDPLFLIIRLLNSEDAKLWHPLGRQRHSLLHLILMLIALRQVSDGLSFCPCVGGHGRHRSITKVLMRFLMMVCLWCTLQIVRTCTHGHLRREHLGVQNLDTWMCIFLNGNSLVMGPWKLGSNILYGHGLRASSLAWNRTVKQCSYDVVCKSIQKVCDEKLNLSVTRHRKRVWLRFFGSYDRFTFDRMSAIIIVFRVLNFWWSFGPVLILQSTNWTITLIINLSGWWWWGYKWRKMWNGWRERVIPLYVDEWERRCGMNALDFTMTIGDKRLEACDRSVIHFQH